MNIQESRHKAFTALDAPSHPLSTPEILHNIFAQHGNKADVYACAQVCRRWNPPAIEVLWRDFSPNLYWILNLHEQNLLAPYLPLMRHVRLTLAGASSIQIQWVRTRMYCLDVRTIAPVNAVSFHSDLNMHHDNLFGEHGHGFFTKKLRSAIIGPRFRKSKVLELVQSRCPQLETLSLSPEREDFIPLERIHTFLLDMPGLRSIEGLISGLTAETLLLLARRPHLERLSIYGYQTAAIFDDLLASKDGLTAFPALRELRIDGAHHNTNPPSRMFCLFGNLRRLKLTVYLRYLEEDITAALTNCPYLTDVNVALNISASADTRQVASLSPQSFQAFFNTCKELRHVQFLCFASGFAYYNMPPQEFAAMLPKLGNIRTLSLPFEIDFPDPAILTKHCPHLSYLRLANRTETISK